MNLLKLACGHKVQTSVELRLQYPTDTHYIYCPSCREKKDNGHLIPTAWQEVVSISNPILTLQEEINAEHLSDVPSEFPSILPGDIMRVQPSVPRNRRRPFPYVEQRGQFS